MYIIDDVFLPKCRFIQNLLHLVDFWQNMDVECRMEAEFCLDLHFARCPRPQRAWVLLNESSSSFLKCIT